MEREIEIKFLNVEYADIRSRLERAGAKLIKPQRLMRRTIIKTPDMIARDAFARVRDEGDKITMTYKQVNKNKKDYDEVEIIVNDYDKAVEILTKCDLPTVSYQETKREQWEMGNVEICIDEWPWANPYIEIEGATEAAVKRVALALGFKMADAVRGTVWNVYWNAYPHLHGQKPDVPAFKFGDPLPQSWVKK